MPASVGELNPTVTHACTSTNPQDLLSYQPPSLLWPRHEESSHAISDWGPSSTPKTKSFTYPTSPVYTAPIYHQRQLYGWVFQWERNINQAQIQQETEESDARGQHRLVCVVKAHVLGKYCMQIKCRSKQKRLRGGCEVCRKQVSWTQHFGCA